MDGLIHRFSVIKKCSSDYDCKIHEALLIKKHQPKLNKQLYENIHASHNGKHIGRYIT